MIGQPAPDLPPATLRETVLYHLARLLSRTEICHSSDMKEALTSPEKYDAYRLQLADQVVKAAERYGVNLRRCDVLDFGCGHGPLATRLLEEGVRSVVGVDCDPEAIARAQALHDHPAFQFLTSERERIPLPDDSFDVVVSHDVFEHVKAPGPILEELYRILRPGGQALIGTWGWYHPFAPHLFSVMPVPWAHLLCGERSLLRAARRVYLSSWYQPMMHDLDEGETLRPDKYTEEELSTDYLNKYLIRDFERQFQSSRFEWRTHLIPFHAWPVRWTAVLLRWPWVREFGASYVWFVLRKPTEKVAS